MVIHKSDTLRTEPAVLLGEVSSLVLSPKKKKKIKWKHKAAREGHNLLLSSRRFYSLGIRIHKIIHHLLDEVFRALLYKLMYLLSAFERWHSKDIPCWFPLQSALMFGVLVLCCVDWPVDCTGKQHTYWERGKLELALHLLTISLNTKLKKYILSTF